MEKIEMMIDRNGYFCLRQGEHEIRLNPEEAAQAFGYFQNNIPEICRRWAPKPKGE